ncbi:UNVERIFIED_CONTAM: Phosphatidylinositol 4-kinase gamma 7 [Sesamum angustifolium]|uniref:1-phosphatidylinositol 4-kinase n=1 Tax=Sesamum angustifolium TaxID=2727405 RepID=A0AAW2RKT8_9LAMI
MIIIGTYIFLVLLHSASKFGVQLRVRGKLSPVAILVAGCERTIGGHFLPFMSHNLDSPVQTQMAVAAFKNPLGSGEYRGTNRMEGKPTCRRRVFVQTETGCVLGMELDRSDNAHTVKRRLQLALNFPVEESSLTFGDIILKNDLSAVRNHSPLLLIRNLMHRSSSTPCLSPTGRDIQQNDQSGPIEIFGPLKSLCQDQTTCKGNCQGNEERG